MSYIGKEPKNTSYSKEQVDALFASQDALSELDDVTITSNTTGEILVWDGAKFVNKTLTEAGIDTSAEVDAKISAEIDDLSGVTNASGARTNLSVDSSAEVTSKISANSMQDVLEDTSPQLGGDLDANGKTFDASSYRQIANASVSSGTHTFNFANGDFQKVTASGAITLGTSNFVTGKACAFTFELISSGNTITLPTSWKFDSGTPPSLSATGTDTFLLMKDSSEDFTLYVLGLDVRVV